MTRRGFGLAVGVAVVLGGPARSEIAWDAREVVGVVRATDTASVDIGLEDGAVVTVALSQTPVVVVGVGIDRNDLQPGEIVALSASAVPVDGGVGYIARSFMTAGSATLAGRFIRESHPAADARHLDQRAIIGPMRRLVAGLVLEIEQAPGLVSVKLGPEALGYRLRPGGLPDVMPGSRVSIPVTRGFADAILVMMPR